jgi:hypothetical protein
MGKGEEFLEPLWEHQREVEEKVEQLEFLHNSFDFRNPKPFLEEVVRIGYELRGEIFHHFNLLEASLNPISPQCQKIVKENLLVREILVRMTDFIIREGEKGSWEGFQKLEELREILNAYFLKEKGVLKEEIERVTTPVQRRKIGENLKFWRGKLI